MRNLQFPELPRQWSSQGYEIDELLGQGSYGAVYRMVRNKGTDQEEYWALKVIEKNLTKKRIRFQYRNDIAAARRDFGKEFNKLAREVNILESFMDEKHIVQIKGSCLEKMPEENYWRAYIQMEYLTELMDYAYPEEEDLESSNLESSDSQNQDFKFTEERMNQEKIIAREWDDGSMTVIGTRNYMAPEVYNTFYDKSADIYSLGMVLYYFANDMRLPFWDLHDSVAQMNARCKGELPEPKTAFEPLRRIILKACAFEPKDRYQSAADMRADLENAKSIGNKEKEIRKYV